MMCYVAIVAKMVVSYARKILRCEMMEYVIVRGVTTRLPMHARHAPKTAEAETEIHASSVLNTLSSTQIPVFVPVYSDSILVLLAVPVCCAMMNV